MYYFEKKVTAIAWYYDLANNYEGRIWAFHSTYLTHGYYMYYYTCT